LRAIFGQGLRALYANRIAGDGRHRNDVRTTAGAHQKVLSNIEALPPAKYEGAEKRDITFPVGPGQTMTVTGQQFLNHSAMPQFFFHCTTAYDILRHKGVELGKRDFSASELHSHFLSHTAQRRFSSSRHGRQKIVLCGHNDV
jgi:hypothetical protein